ncbi:PAS domain S-box protein [Methanogenium marinum]|uniref:PAS domain S-box protein n=1 Tax=Methanogenium marinum TaxID=348610 RepID=A0A9Q4KTF6_9EURY|nr:PAS domain S-box protein [Methanogenium marinum]MDE4907672.1 PAS domain S-box protein [Methanogenium marinum]
MASAGTESQAISLLYVDDEPALLEMSKKYLEHSGTFAVTIASSAKDGIRELVENPFDAIISDYEMPDMNGIEFLQYLRAEGNTIPFLIFTGRGREEVVIEALNNGVDFYIQKGGDPRSQFAELINKIHYAVSRRRSEEALRVSEERYRFITDNVADNIWMFDMEFNLTYASPSGEIMRGFTAEEDLAQSLEEKMTPASCERVVRRFQEELAISAAGTADPKRVILFETEEYCKDGSTIWVENSVRCLRDYNGESAGVIGVSRDITWRKQAEDALRQSEERYRSLAENSPVGIVTCDCEGTIDYVNLKMLEILGSPGIEETRNINILTFPPLEDTGLTNILKRVIETGVQENYMPVKYLSKWGKTIFFRGYISPFSRDGSVFGAQIIVDEITESGK